MKFCFRPFRHTVTALLFIQTILCPAGAQGDISARYAAYAPFSIDISPFTDFFAALPVDEQQEQLKDWALYGLLSSLGFDDARISGISDGAAEMRYASLRDTAHFPILAGRIAFPAESEWVMLVPRDAADDALLQGALFDHYRLSHSAVPERVHIFSFAIDASSGITTAFVRTARGNAFLTGEYGYFESEIADAAGLREFLAQTNDLISVKFNDAGILCGGRKNKFGARGSLGYEDIAALYQAYVPYQAPGQERERRKSYERFITEKYQELAAKDANLKRAIKTGRAKYSMIMAKIKKAFPYTTLREQDVNVGFSLDPLFDYAGIAEEISALATRSGPYAGINGDAPLAALVGARAAALAAVSRDIGSKHTLLPLLRLRREFSKAQTAPEMQLDNLLQNIERTHTYQNARYDGDIKGTGPAMILFYTDLTAKLWALDFNGLAPRGKVTGFRALADIKVPKLYWDDFIKLSKTRLWFGLKQESFDIAGNELTFDPVSTRVYAASSDPLYPGKESKPNYQSGEFLGWWDRHYAEVAAYEPYFHKLNQLLKWSCLLTVLKEKKPRALEFLRSAAVPRTLDFEAWYPGENSLLAKTSLPFVDRNKFHAANECFSSLSSASYPLMGRSFFVTGGVSLASRKDIQAKLHKPPTRLVSKTASAARRPAFAKKGGHTQAQKAATVERTAPAPKNAFGELAGHVEGHTIKLAWRKSEGAVLDEYVNALVNREAAPQKQARNENLLRGLKNTESVVRIEEGKTYLIKTGELRNRWIYLAINAQGTTAEFPARAAGTEPDSDIFCAKTISSAQAHTLISHKNGVTLFP